MQTNFLHRVLKWTLIAGTASSLATACVVTSGDGTSDDNDGGEGGSSTAGTKPTAGGKGGSQASGGGGKGGSQASGGGGSGGKMPAAGSGGGGGTPSTYVPGVCEADGATPAVEPSCAPVAGDKGETCKICLKAKCCSEWKSCYAKSPTIACGWGATEDAPGQFDCVQNCFVDGAATAITADALLVECGEKCANQCDIPDGGLLMQTTSDLVACANDMCQNDCFPF